MNKEVIKLDNGLTIVCVNDDSKHYIGASIFVNVGGCVKDYIIDGKEYHYKDGLAHLLEHVIIDESRYGNISKYFQDNYVDFNGITSRYNTQFFINTYEDFESHLVKLINIVHNASFTYESVEHSKGPVFEEIKGKKDGRGIDFYFACNESIYNNPEFIMVSGEVEDVKGFTNEDLELFYNAFYKPSNEIIAVYGNYDIKKIVKLIEDTYNSIDRTYLDCKVLEKEEELKVKREYNEYVLKNDLPLSRITYKMKFDGFKDIWKDTLLIYLDCFLGYNFGRKSKIYNELSQEGVIKFPFSFDVDTAYRLNYLIVSVTNVTDNPLVMDKIKETLNRKEFPSREEFNSYKKNKIMTYILSEDNPERFAIGYVNNVLDYDYFEFDKFEDVSLLDYDTMVEFVESLDFSNFCVNVRKNN